MGKSGKSKSAPPRRKIAGAAVAFLKPGLAAVRKAMQNRPAFQVKGPADTYWNEINELYPAPRDLEKALAGSILDKREADLLPIGNDGMGNTIAVGISGNRRGAVFFVDEDYSPRHRQRAVKLATSLARFASEVLKKESDEAPGRTDDEFAQLIGFMSAGMDLTAAMKAVDTLNAKARKSRK